MRCSAYEGLSRVVGKATAFRPMTWSQLGRLWATLSSPEPRLLVAACQRGGIVWRELEHRRETKGEGRWERANGLGSVHGVRRRPSSYASSRVAHAGRDRTGRARRGGALRPVRKSEVFGPGWTQAVSTDHSKPSTEDEVRQLQGFDQGLDRWQGNAHRARRNKLGGTKWRWLLVSG
jgi:hypothetical protein